jgi:crotonobetainyl-CoA:carnitine CoA-transferase CaiB-like acyl-CoA transferase
VHCAAARTVEDMFDDPQVQAEGMLTRFEHPTLGSYRGFAGAVEFDRTPGPPAFAAPMLGQHTEALKAAAQEGR